MTVFKTTRRKVLLATGGATAVVGAGALWLKIRGRKTRGPVGDTRLQNEVFRGAGFAPNVFVSIDTDGTVTVWNIRSEMGQGIGSALAMLVAEELDADWKQVRVQQATVEAKIDYGSQFTAASASIAKDWKTFRQAGAIARAMLVAAAARQWDVSKDECTTRNGVVYHERSGKNATYGQLAERAGKEKAPRDPPLKSPDQYRLLGTPAVRLDLREKVTGQARFGLDVRVDDMLIAVVARCPTFGGAVSSIDDTATRAVPDVVNVLRIDTGVAVVARNTWAALQGRLALKVNWNGGANAASNTHQIEDDLMSELEKPGTVWKESGKPLQHISRPGTIEASFLLPYLAHATMEPMNAVAHVTSDRCEIWAPTQDPDGARDLAARTAKLAPEKVIVHKTFLGGGFGRRTNNDEVAEAVQVSQALGKPIQLVWSREDDMQHGRYREASAHRLHASLDSKGMPIAWSHRIVTASPDKPAAGEVNGIALMGAELPYAVANHRIAWSSCLAPVPTTIWRSVGHSHNAFVMETFLDELAFAAAQDPIAYRRHLLRGKPRLLNCLERVAALSDWHDRRAQGQSLGVAIAECFGSFVAQVAKVSVTGKNYAVDAVWCVTDCGRVVNPDTVVAQIEGGIIFGLTAAQYGKLQVDGGAIVESNFDGYPLLRMLDCPRIAVELVLNRERNGGVGEVGVPTLAPAVANALFAATGHRIRKLPILLA
ncbi:MAG: xanthine dehydrogenase family protein molybdopterin-binding subunit [Deltaproteobacteria bacterium]|nr:xanthine dehydrogenase family protein molybdopterin-binding subunit [Deltaproteobacteria bacterium]